MSEIETDIGCDVYGYPVRVRTAGLAGNFWIAAARVTALEDENAALALGLVESQRQCRDLLVLLSEAYERMGAVQAVAPAQFPARALFCQAPVSA